MYMFCMKHCGNNDRNWSAHLRCIVGMVLRRIRWRNLCNGVDDMLIVIRRWDNPELFQFIEILRNFALHHLQRQPATTVTSVFVSTSPDPTGGRRLTPALPPHSEFLATPPSPLHQIKLDSQNSTQCVTLSTCLWHLDLSPLDTVTQLASSQDALYRQNFGENPFAHTKYCRNDIINEGMHRWMDMKWQWATSLFDLAICRAFCSAKPKAERQSPDLDQSSTKLRS